VNAANYYGHTALIIASVSSSNPEIMTALMKNGADVNAAENEYGNTVLMGVVSKRGVVVEEILALIDNGADVNARNNAGWTPVMLAAEYSGDAKVIHALAEGGADVNANSRGWTPLMLAAIYNKNPAVAAALIERGADVEARDKNGRTALDVARDVKAPPGVIAALEKATLR
jgi:ankyrin repeat protein